MPRSNISVPNTRDKIVRKNYENGPRNGPAPGSASRSSDVRVRAPLDNVSTSASGNNSLPSAKPGPPSPSRNLAASSADDRSRTGIVYPLQPRSQRPDVYIEVEATLPEPAALLCPDLQQQPAREVPTSLSRPSRRHCRKRRRNRSTALYRPAKRSPPRGYWCDI